MNTQALKAFISVMTENSVSRAAEKLHLTQPAITKRIRMLEQEFDTRLFIPLGRGIQPTQSAFELLPRAKQWLLDYEEIKHAISNATQQIRGTLKIGTSHHIGLHHLQPILKPFIQQYPEVQLDVHFVDSEQAHHAVLTGELELAFLTLPPKLQQTTTETKLYYEPLWHDELKFVCAPFHPLALLNLTQQHISLTDLIVYPAQLPAVNTFMSEITLNAFAKHGLKPQANTNTNPLESIRMLVAVGLGWSVLPLSLINEELTILNIKEVSLSRELGLVRHPQRTLSAGAQAFISHVLTMV